MIYQSVFLYHLRQTDDVHAEQNIPRRSVRNSSWWTRTAREAQRSGRSHSVEQGRAAASGGSVFPALVSSVEEVKEGNMVGLFFVHR